MFVETHEQRTAIDARDALGRVRSLECFRLRYAMLVPLQWGKPSSIVLSQHFTAAPASVPSIRPDSVRSIHHPSSHSTLCARTMQIKAVTLAALALLVPAALGTTTTTVTVSYDEAVNVLAVDHAQSGFNVALGAMNALTGGQARHLGRINATAKQVDKSKCGL
ncbi:hypothetical protein BN946_scf184940.g31 [Trametes cinnabarina]|uniref:Uncharacterized protein n=1 Tax=Pycnoporus cinnabarinus TaxID=5643 RepID=A0A060SI46_PYCCI|nr:hypothetical protein BN946_scf184940.g31 [Trametes cinnabarina]